MATKRDNRDFVVKMKAADMKVLLWGLLATIVVVAGAFLTAVVLLA